VQRHLEVSAATCVMVGGRLPAKSVPVNVVPRSRITPLSPPGRNGLRPPGPASEQNEITPKKARKFKNFEPTIRTAGKIPERGPSRQAEARHPCGRLCCSTLGRIWRLIPYQPCVRRRVASRNANEHGMELSRARTRTAGRVRKWIRQAPGCRPGDSLRNRPA